MVEIQNFLTIFSKGVLMKKIFVFGCLLLVSQMAMAVNWVNTDIHTIDNSFTYYVDYDSIVLNKFQSNTERYYLSAWVKGQSNKPNIIRGTNIILQKFKLMNILIV